MAKIYGVGFPLHNHSSAFIEDGKIKYAVEDDKMMRTKTPWIWGYSSGMSLQAIEDATGVSLEEADYIGIGDTNLVMSYYSGFNKGLEEDYKKQSLIKQLNKIKKSKAQVKYYSHHDCHAASTYYLSGFDKALIVTLDGGNNEHELGTIQLGNGLNMTRVHTLSMHTNANSLATSWFYLCSPLGFVGNKDEGKIMGMAGHGQYNKRLAKGFKSLLSYNKGDLSFGPTAHDYIYEWFYKQLEKEGWFKTDQGKVDVAYALQKHTEDLIVEYLKDIAQRYPDYKNICFAGGLFANVKVNQVINEMGYFNNIFVTPGMGDESIALGAAILASVECGDWKPYKLENAFLGFSYNQDQIEQEALKHESLVKIDFDYKKVAELLNEGKILGLYQGRFEFGPRALGSRSIMVRATDPETHEMLNERLKRNEIMPFAPFVLGEQAHNIFNIEGSEHTAEFMTITYTCKDEWVNKIPAVIHKVDNTGRPQLVYKHNNPVFYNIVNEYYKISGIPVLLNTSFNAHGEPINIYPDQVFKHLIDGVVDYLVTEYGIYYKKEKNEEDKNNS
jgi:carbamoyltransferase